MALDLSEIKDMGQGGFNRTEKSALAFIFTGFLIKGKYVLKTCGIA